MGKLRHEIAAIIILLSLTLFFSSYSQFLSSGKAISKGSSSPDWAQSWAGVPWDVENGETLVSADFQDSNAVITAKGDWIWRTGWIWKGGQWQSFEFPQTSQYDGWAQSSVSAEIPLSSEEVLDGENYVLAYTCNYKNNKWYCGCLDTDNCGRWQLQTFDAVRPDVVAQDMSKVLSPDTPAAEKQAAQENMKKKNKGLALTTVSQLKGDFNLDKKVDLDDFFSFAEGFDKREGQNGYDTKFDLSGNKIIDFDDFFIFVENFGKTIERTDENSYIDVVSDLPITKNYDIFEDTFSEEKAYSDSYIIEFKSKPLLEVKKEIEDEIDKKRLDIENAAKRGATKPSAEALRQIEELEKSMTSRIEEGRTEINQDYSRLLSDLGRRATKPTSEILTDRYKNIFSGAKVDITAEEARELRKKDYVENVHPDTKFKALMKDSAALVNADKVWRLDKDLKNCTITKNKCLTGKDIKVAVIDTGVDYTHPAFGSCTKEQFLQKQCDRVIDGYDFVNKDNDPMDDVGHGTHVAGTIAGFDSNYFLYHGVAPEAKIIAYKVLNAEGRGGLSAILAALDRSVDPNDDKDFSDHVDIVSMSLGGFAPYWIASEPVDRVVDAGVVVVVAAGNEGRDESIASPGTSSKAITVGSSTHLLGGKSGGPDKISAFSSRGPAFNGEFYLNKPDLVAPGGDIYDFPERFKFGIAAPFSPNVNNDPNLCALKKKDICYDDDNKAETDYIRFSGTSMATPHVSGAAAILKQLHPEWMPEEIKDVLKYTAKDIGYTKDYQGAGRLDIEAAVKLHTPPPVAQFSRVVKTGDDIIVEGSAHGKDFDYYTLELQSENSQPILLTKSDNQAKKGLLHKLDMKNYPEGSYKLILKVKSKNLETKNEMIIKIGDSWSKETDLPYAVASHVAVAYNGKIWLLGGYKSDSLKSVYSFDGKRWIKGTDMPYELYGHNAVIYNGKIWVFGRSISRELNEIYSFDGSTWVKEDDMPIINGFSVVFNGKIFVIGGGTSEIPSKKVFSFDGIRWKEEMPLPKGNIQLNAITYKGKIWVIGGVDVDSKTMQDVYSFDGSTWVKEDDMPEAIRGYSTAVYDGKLWVIGGGKSIVEYSRKVFSFDGKIWKLEESLPSVLVKQQSVVYNNKLWVMGGWNGYYSSSIYSLQAKNPKPQTCIDSDGGFNPEIRGATKDKNSDAKEDKCIDLSTHASVGSCNDKNCGLREFECTDDYGFVSYNDIKCTTGCNTGECKLNYPIINYNQVKEKHNLRRVFEISAEVRRANSAFFFYRFDGKGDFKKIEMDRGFGATYGTAIPLLDKNIKFFEYYISSSNEYFTSTYPEGGKDNPIRIEAFVASTYEWVPRKIISYKTSNTAVTLNDVDNSFGVIKKDQVTEFELTASPVVAVIRGNTKRDDYIEAKFEWQSGKVGDIKIFLPEVTGLTDAVILYIADDGSTYWRFNDALNIDNQRFYDALKKEDIAMAAPQTG